MQKLRATQFLGAAVSLTGKYSTNGEHTKNGYELAVKRINDMGGVKVGGRAINLKSYTTMMSLTQKELLN